MGIVCVSCVKFTRTHTHKLHVTKFVLSLILNLSRFFQKLNEDRDLKNKRANLINDAML